jgi:DNA-binding response OmpR family regulator
MRRLLIIARETRSAETIADMLAPCATFRISVAGSVTEAVALGAAEERQIDAALVVGAGTADNPSLICARLRQIWPNCPVIFLADAATEQDVVRALEGGASDFLMSPFRPAELAARLRAQIRAHANSADIVIRIGSYRFAPATRMIENTETGETIRLTQKEAEVLKFLHRADGQPVARQTLLRDVWGYRDGADSYTVESHVYRLRRKIEANPSRPRYLVNDAGGYLLVTAPSQARNQAAAGPALPLAV